MSCSTARFPPFVHTHTKTLQRHSRQQKDSPWTGHPLLVLRETIVLSFLHSDRPPCPSATYMTSTHSTPQRFFSKSYCTSMPRTLSPVRSSQGPSTPFSRHTSGEMFTWARVRQVYSASRLLGSFLSTGSLPTTKHKVALIIWSLSHRPFKGSHHGYGRSRFTDTSFQVD
jgi:hypothetical protein